MHYVWLIVLSAFLALGCERKDAAAPPGGSGPASPEMSISSLTVEKTIPVPAFGQSEVPGIFNDIAYISLNKQLMVSNSVGLGEFPLRANGDINFDKAFVAPCKGCHMRGFTEIGSGLVAALLWERKVLSVSESRAKGIDYTLPAEITDASGLARLGKHYLVSDRAAKEIFVLELVPADKTTRIVRRFPCAGPGIESVTVKERIIWSTDGENLYEYDQDLPVRKIALPSPVAGFCFAGRYMYAAAKDKAEIYRYLTPADGSQETRSTKPEMQHSPESPQGGKSE